MTSDPILRHLLSAHRAFVARAISADEYESALDAVIRPWKAKGRTVTVDEQEAETDRLRSIVEVR